MTGTPNEQELFDEFFLWLKAKGLQDPLLIEPRTREGAGKGLFVSRSIPANSIVVKLPSAALMNIRTLRNLYGDCNLEGYSAKTGGKMIFLNGTQLISLHLALHRPPRHGGRSTDPTFGPYISVLPKEFDSHPLTWLIKQNPAAFEEGDAAFGGGLLGHLPPSVSSELTTMSNKFLRDWDIVRNCWEAHLKRPDEASADNAAATGSPQAVRIPLRYPNFLWAWLIVNTRCLYIRLFNHDYPLTNLTLCPLIDFANHTTSQDTRPGAFPQIRCTNEARLGGSNNFLAPGATHDMAFVSHPDRELIEGEEVFLRYGGHCNRALFVEYGFVDEHGEPSISEVNVEDLMDALFRDAGEVGDACRDVLQREGYTKNLCLFLSPSPPHPSYTVISALRLLASRLSGRGETLQASWAAVLAGRPPDGVDVSVRQSLERLCQTIAERSKRALDHLKEKEQQSHGTLDAPPWSSWAVRNVRKLWDEEDKVACAVLGSLQGGVQISDFP
ncbi:SET domain-containing protein [Schizopora paradoxa]|uniref:SET domain-containing protein n=1 Tax=Schizopora paradoxa TaxID=27342 RepID=A0A0H2SA56_9AGAM|nr:SET domain-containing protein [Schizopora paradoxa]